MTCAGAGARLRVPLHLSEATTHYAMTGRNTVFHKTSLWCQNGGDNWVHFTLIFCASEILEVKEELHHQHVQSPEKGSSLAITLEHLRTLNLFFFYVN